MEVHVGRFNKLQIDVLQYVVSKIFITRSKDLFIYNFLTLCLIQMLGLGLGPTGLGLGLEQSGLGLGPTGLGLGLSGLDYITGLNTVLVLDNHQLIQCLKVLEFTAGKLIAYCWSWYHAVQQITEQPPLTSTIQRRRLILFSHLARMDESADVKRILTAVPLSDWKRPPGRPQ